MLGSKETTQVEAFENLYSFVAHECDLAILRYKRSKESYSYRSVYQSYHLIYFTRIFNGRRSLFGR